MGTQYLTSTSTNPPVLEHEHDLDKVNTTLNYGGMGDKLDHLMHSDTMILVVGMLAMIVIALLIRSLCLRLSKDNSRKQLMREGIKQIAGHMDLVTRSMSNDLELPNSPKKVIRTYSGRGRSEETEPDYSKEKRGSLREIAFSNNLRAEMEYQDNEGKAKKATLEKRDSLKQFIFGDKTPLPADLTTKQNIGDQNEDKPAGVSLSETNLVNHYTFSSISRHVCNTNHLSQMLERGDSLKEIAFNNNLNEEVDYRVEDDMKQITSSFKKDSLREIVYCSGLNQNSETYIHTN